MLSSAGIVYPQMHPQFHINHQLSGLVACISIFVSVSTEKYRSYHLPLRCMQIACLNGIINRLIKHPTWKLQVVLTALRANSLLSTSFQGIDRFGDAHPPIKSCKYTNNEIENWDSTNETNWHCGIDDYDHNCSTYDQKKEWLKYMLKHTTYI